jgi:hypothetical protein
MCVYLLLGVCPHTSKQMYVEVSRSKFVFVCEALASLEECTYLRM